MRIVVIGGTRSIGSQLVATLRAHGLEAVAASPEPGVNTLTGEGMAEVLEGATVVVDGEVGRVDVPLAHAVRSGRRCD